MTAHVVQMSGGLGSFWAAVRVAEEYGTADMTLLFADTLVEDQDLYRFLADASEYLGLPIVRVLDGRTPFEVFKDVRFLGNSRVAPCSKHLKQLPCRTWLTNNCDPNNTIVYVGIDATEARRIPQIVQGWSPWETRFPLVSHPSWDKARMIEECVRIGITPPRLYGLGFAHNNCGGVCVRAGASQWRRLLSAFPARYARAEGEEAQLRDELGNVSILRRQTAGVRHSLTLEDLRLETEHA
jgi:hypothetical protein